MNKGELQQMNRLGMVGWKIAGGLNHLTRANPRLNPDAAPNLKHMFDVLGLSISPMKCHDEIHNHKDYDETKYKAWWRSEHKETINWNTDNDNQAPIFWSRLWKEETNSPSCS